MLARHHLSELLRLSAMTSIVIGTLFLIWIPDVVLAGLVFTIMLGCAWYISWRRDVLFGTIVAENTIAKMKRAPSTEQIETLLKVPPVVELEQPDCLQIWARQTRYEAEQLRARVRARELV